MMYIRMQIEKGFHNLLQYGLNNTPQAYHRPTFYLLDAK